MVSRKVILSYDMGYYVILILSYGYVQYLFTLNLYLLCCVNYILGIQYCNVE